MHYLWNVFSLTASLLKMSARKVGMSSPKTVKFQELSLPIQSSHRSVQMPEDLIRGTQPHPAVWTPNVYLPDRHRIPQAYERSSLAEQREAFFLTLYDEARPASRGDFEQRHLASKEDSQAQIDPPMRSTPKRQSLMPRAIQDSVQITRTRLSNSEGDRPRLDLRDEVDAPVVDCGDSSEKSKKKEKSGFLKSLVVKLFSAGRRRKSEQLSTKPNEHRGVEYIEDDPFEEDFLSSVKVLRGNPSRESSSGSNGSYEELGCLRHPRRSISNGSLSGSLCGGDKAEPSGKCDPETLRDIYSA